MAASECDAYSQRAAVDGRRTTLPESLSCGAPPDDGRGRALVWVLLISLAAVGPGLRVAGCAHRCRTIGRRLTRPTKARPHTPHRPYRRHGRRERRRWGIRSPALNCPALALRRPLLRPRRRRARKHREAVSPVRQSRLRRAWRSSPLRRGLWLPHPARLHTPLHPRRRRGPRELRRWETPGPIPHCPERVARRLLPQLYKTGTQCL